LNDNAHNDPRLHAIPDIHGHAKGEHKAFSDERPIPLSARMLFLWFYHACKRGWPRFLMVTDHMNYLTFEDPAAINLVRRALKLAQAGDLYGAAETASVEVGQAAIVSEGLRRGMRYSIGAEVDNDPRSRPDAQNIVDAMKPDGTIRSVHFLTIDHPVHGPNWNWPFDNPEFADVFEVVGAAKTWELYMATLLDAIERLSGNILGHFYVPALFGHWPDDATLDTYENRLIDACEARGMAIEFNTRFLYRDHTDEEKARYLAAHRRLLTKCKAKKVGIAIGSDAHSPKDQGGAFETVLRLLDECEINELVFPIAGRLARVALRVERRVEPVPGPAAPPIEERKVVRRSRASDPAPVEAIAVATAEPSAEPVDATRPKARPKRSRGKAAESPAISNDGATPAAALPSGTTSVPKARPANPRRVKASVQGAHSAERSSEWPHEAALEVDTTAIVTGPATVEASFADVVTETAVVTQPNEPFAASDAASPVAELATAELATAELATEELATEESATEELATEELATEELATEELATEESATEESATEESATEESTTEELADREVTVAEKMAAGEVAAEDAAAKTAGEDTAAEAEADAAAVRAGAEKVAIGYAIDDPVPERASSASPVEAPGTPTSAESAGSETATGAAPTAAPARIRKTRPKPAPAKPKAGARPKGPAARANSAAKKAAKPTAKAPGKATGAKRVAARKTTSKGGAGKSAAKKAPTKKAAVKKIPPKKAAVRPAGAKKTAVKKSAVKKSSPKKPAQRRR